MKTSKTSNRSLVNAPVRDKQVRFITLALCMAVCCAQAQPISVKFQQKISTLEGNFNGYLDYADHFGYAAASIGDFDHDGIPDIAVGVPDDDDGGIERGALYILFLNENGTIKAHQKISDTQGSFTGDLDNGDRFGSSVTSLGDLNEDGITDIAVGARFDDDGPGGNNDRGAVWILFLDTNGSVKTYQKISDMRGSFKGNLDDVDLFGTSVEAIGDLDGDGITELVVGALNDDDGGNSRGAVWILFLNSDGTVKSYQKLSDTQGDFTGILNNTDCFGSSICSIGDLDKDSINDIVVGAYQDDDGGNNKGALWVLFLNADGTVKNHQKISSTDGNFTGAFDDADFFGYAVDSIGDLNNDGITDIVVGAPGDDDGGTNRGAVWILFLNRNGTVNDFQKISNLYEEFGDNLSDNDFLGWSVSTIGDVDKDGISDIFAGAYGDNDGGTDKGAIWVMTLNNAVVLGIELHSFTASAIDEAILLKWETTYEFNNSEFALERSVDGVSFKPIATIPGAGQSDFDSYYSYTDDDPISGTSYYRLKQTDYNENFTYSNIISVNVDKEALFIASPNPASSTVRIIFNSDIEELIMLNINNTTLKNVLVQSIEAKEGFNEIDLNVAHLSRGIYFITLEKHNELLTNMFFKN